MNFAEPGIKIGVAAAVYLALFGAANWIWLRRTGVNMTVFTTAVCSLPAVLGAVLASTSTEDYRQYVARVAACAVFTPVLLLFWSGSLEAAARRRVWPFAVSAAAAHAVVFVAGVFWFGQSTTRIARDPDVPSVDDATLVARLRSLGLPSAPFDVSQPSPGQLAFSFRFAADEGRSHTAYLAIDAENRSVRVRERLSAKAARPRDEAESSMRRPGDPLADPARPKATSVSSAVAQTTLIEAARLRSIPVTLAGGTAQAPADFLAALDGEGMVTLLCAVVTRSGWDWEPVFFGDN